MGFLSKANPKATWKSVLRSALMSAAIGLAIYGIVIYRNQWLDEWPLKLMICAVLCASVGALFEWQVSDDDSMDQLHT